MIELIDEPPTPPGAIPPGMKPEVDIFWSLIPQKIVKDNFGSRIGKLFYGIEVVIGNNSGYDLQIASVGFNLGPVGRAATEMNRTYDTVINEVRKNQTASLNAVLSSIDKTCSRKEGLEFIECRNKHLTTEISKANDSHRALVGAVKQQADLWTQFSRVPYNQKVPVSSYRMARGSIEHGQFLSFRNLGVNSIKALGPILTGLLPFFHAVNHRSNFSQAINVFNNPFEKGFELLVPEETITQMQRLDDGILRDGMIIQNNRQFRTRVLFPKDLLQLEGGLRDNSIMVTQALGQMYLIGDTVKFINRVSVTSAGSGEVLPPPRLSPKDIELILGDTQTFDVSGTFLEGASVASDDPTNIKVISVSSTRTSATIQVNILPKAAIGPHTFLLSTAGGTASIPVNFTQPKPVLTSAVAFAPSNPTINTPDKEYTFTVEGRFFQTAELAVADNSKTAIRLVSTKPDVTEGGTRLSGKFNVLEGAQPNNYTINITNAQNEDVTPVTISVGNQTAPTVKDDEVKQTTVPPAHSTSDGVTLIVKGENLFNATLEPANADKEKGITVNVEDNQKPDTLTAKVFVNEKTPQGEYELELRNANRADDAVEKVKFTVGPQGDISITKIDPENIKATGEEQPISIVITGSNLRAMQQITFEPNLPWQKNEAESIHVSNGETLTLDVKVPATVKAGDKVAIKLKNSNGKEVTREIDVVAPPAPPTPSITKFQVGGADVESAAVGANLVIVDQNLKGATAVKFGDTPELVPGSVQDGQITVVIPNVAPGVIEVVVTTTPGTTARKSITITPP